MFIYFTFTSDILTLRTIRTTKITLQWFLPLYSIGDLDNSFLGYKYTGRCWESTVALTDLCFKMVGK